MKRDHLIVFLEGMVQGLDEDLREFKKKARADGNYYTAEKKGEMTFAEGAKFAYNNILKELKDD